MKELVAGILSSIGFNRIVFVVAVWNVIVFLLYGIDKLKAKSGAWRISEKALLLCAFFLGGVGAFAGMKVFRHKTRHTSFNILVPLFAVMCLAAMCFLYYLNTK